MIGPSGNKGGIAIVINTIRENYKGISFLSSYPENKNRSRLLHFIKCIARLHQILRTQIDINIVHLHVASKGSFVRKSILMLIAKAHRRKAILHMHGGSFHIFYNKSIIHKTLIKNILNRADAVICLSDSWRLFYKSISKQKTISVIGNPVNKIKCNESIHTTDTVQLLFLGKICDEKGIFELVEILCKNESYLDGKIKLSIAGFGESQRLIDQIELLDTKQNIQFIGWIEGEEKANIICKSDVYILPSHFEGLPVSIIECMMCSKPIIATNVGGISTLVENGFNGWLFNPSNTSALDLILNNMIQNKQLLKQFGENSFMKSKIYTPENVKQDLVKLYLK